MVDLHGRILSAPRVNCMLDLYGRSFPPFEAIVCWSSTERSLPPLKAIVCWISTWRSLSSLEAITQLNFHREIWRPPEPYLINRKKKLSIEGLGVSSGEIASEVIPKGRDLYQASETLCKFLLEGYRSLVWKVKTTFLRDSSPPNRAMWYHIWGA